MKKIILLITCFFIFCTDSVIARKTIIKMATLAPEGTPWYALIAKMGERWSEETNGNIRPVSYTHLTQPTILLV